MATKLYVTKLRRVLWHAQDSLSACVDHRPDSLDSHAVVGEHRAPDKGSAHADSHKADARAASAWTDRPA
jgi:hypothetical protein